MEKIGYFCTFTPKELIRAAGFTPVRILAGDRRINLANAHIQSYCCSQVKGCLENLLTGNLDIEGAVFTRSCDSLMRLTDIWEMNSKMEVYDLEFPTKIDENSRGYLMKELYDFKNWLEKLSGEEISLDDLKGSIDLYDELEEILGKIYSIKPDYELILKAETQDVEEVIEEGKKRLEELENSKNPQARVLVTGSVCPFLEVYELIESVGFTIVDDLCTGTRFFRSDAQKPRMEKMEDAMFFLIDKYFLKAPCPTKEYGRDRRFNYLLERAEEADGVIFLLLKFCEPHFFDYSQLKNELGNRGKRTLLLELEFPIASYEQQRTRLEAFHEMVVG